MPRKKQEPETHPAVVLGMFQQVFAQQIAAQLAELVGPILDARIAEVVSALKSTNPPDDEDLIDVHEVALMLGCHPRTVPAKEKRIASFPKGIRTGGRAIRWKRGEIRAFIANAPRGVGNLTAL